MSYMEQVELERLISVGLSTRQMARDSDCSQATIRHWLKRYGLKTSHPIKDGSGPKNTICAVCGNPMGANPRNLSKCGSCMTAIRRFLTKRKAIQLLGGECIKCGYNDHPAGLEFHHVHGKDFTIGQVANKSWTVIVEELKRCVLLCAICHKIEHSKRTKEYLVIAAMNYKGKFIGHQDNLVKSVV